MKSEAKYIPALKYDWLTGFYDAVVNLTMPEEKFKRDLVNQALIKEDSKVLDFGCGSLTLSHRQRIMESPLQNSGINSANGRLFAGRAAWNGLVR